MGYSERSKGYKLWDPESKKMIVPRDVVFREEEIAKSEVEFEILHSAAQVIDRGGELRDPVNNLGNENSRHSAASPSDHEEYSPNVVAEANDDSNSFP